MLTSGAFNVPLMRVYAILRPSGGFVNLYVALFIMEWKLEGESVDFKRILICFTTFYFPSIAEIGSFLF